VNNFEVIHMVINSLSTRSIFKERLEKSKKNKNIIEVIHTCG
jgi:hypothetical protein